MRKLINNIVVNTIDLLFVMLPVALSIFAYKTDQDFLFLFGAAGAVFITIITYDIEGLSLFDCYKTVHRGGEITFVTIIRRTKVESRSLLGLMTYEGRYIIDIFFLRFRYFKKVKKSEQRNIAIRIRAKNPINWN